MSPADGSMMPSLALDDDDARTLDGEEDVRVAQEQQQAYN